MVGLVLCCFAIEVLLLYDQQVLQYAQLTSLKVAHREHSLLGGVHSQYLGAFRLADYVLGDSGGAAVWPKGKYRQASFLWVNRNNKPTDHTHHLGTPVPIGSRRTTLGM